MTDEEMKAALKAQKDELTALFTSQLNTKLSEAETKFKADADARVAKAQAENHRAQVKAKFESAIKAEIILPAKRESFYRFNKVDDDASVIQIKLEDVDAYIEEFGDKAKLSASKKPVTKGGETDPAEVGKSAAEVVHLRARKLCLSQNRDPSKFQDINAATIEVLKSDKALGEAYKLLGDAPGQAA